VIWLTLLRRFWPYIAAAGLCIAIALWHLAQVRQAHREGYKAAQIEYEARLVKQREEQFTKHQESEREWQNELADLQRRSVTVLSQPVRLCVSSPSLPAADTVTGSADASPGGRHAVQAGGDLGPALREYGEDCERMRRQLKQAQRDSGL
jgi:hypothetical protein